MSEKIIIIINGFHIKGLGNTCERVMERFNIPIKVRFIRSYSYPPIMFEGYQPSLEIKKGIINIIDEEVEFGLLIDGV